MDIKSGWVGSTETGDPWIKGYRGENIRDVYFYDAGDKRYLTDGFVLRTPTIRSNKGAPVFKRKHKKE